MITYSAVTEQRKVGAHLLRMESRCCSLFPWRNLILDDSSWRWMIWTRDEACCIVPSHADRGAQQAAHLGQSTDGFPKSAAAGAVKWSAGAKGFSYWCRGVALGSDISACCCLRPLNFISGCTAHVSTCWRAHNECKWQNAPNLGPDLISSSLSLAEKDPDPSQHGLSSKKLFFPFSLISYAAKSCFFMVNWLQGSPIMCFWVFNLKIFFFCQLKNMYFTSTSGWYWKESMIQGHSVPDFITKQRKKSGIIFIPLQYLHYLLLHYSCSYLSRRR